MENFLPTPAESVDPENQSAQLNPPQSFKAIGSGILMWLNLSVQLWIVCLAPSMNLIQKQYYFDALIFPTDLQLGHWWRLLTACFTHNNWLTFSLAMLVFVFLARLEKAIGYTRLLLIYFVSGLGALLLTFWIWSLFNLHPPAQMVFASSAALMGLLGSWAFVSFRYWQQTRFNVARNHWVSMLSIFLLQVAYDSIFLKAGLGPLWLHVFGFALGVSITALSFEPLWAWNKHWGRKLLTVTGIWFLLALVVSGVSLYQKANYPLSTAQEAYDSAYYMEMAGARECQVFLSYLFSADKGNALAQDWVGNYFAKKEAPFLQASAPYWWKKAAAQGNLSAARHLADFNARHVNDATAILIRQMETYKPKKYPPIRHVAHTIKLTPEEEAWAKKHPDKAHMVLF